MSLAIPKETIHRSATVLASDLKSLICMARGDEMMEHWNSCER
jgi:hypothetical protein